jgi:DNA-binding Lrp family transcriptional regulator
VPRPVSLEVPFIGVDHTKDNTLRDRGLYHVPSTGGIMVNAIVLLNVESSKINQVAEQLVELDGISEVYSVAGQYDLVVMIRARDDEQIASLVTEQLLQVEGLISSETLIAFRTFSRHDLDGMFSVGLD